MSYLNSFFINVKKFIGENISVILVFLFFNHLALSLSPHCQDNEKDCVTRLESRGIGFHYNFNWNDKQILHFDLGIYLTFLLKKDAIQVFIYFFYVVNLYA